MHVEDSTKKMSLNKKFSRNEPVEDKSLTRYRDKFSPARLISELLTPPSFDLRTKNQEPPLNTVLEQRLLHSISQNHTEDRSQIIICQII